MDNQQRISLLLYDDAVSFFAYYCSVSILSFKSSLLHWLCIYIAPDKLYRFTDTTDQSHIITNAVKRPISLWFHWKMLLLDKVQASSNKVFRYNSSNNSFVQDAAIIVFLGVITFGLLHGINPSHGWTVAVLYSIRNKRPLLSSLTSSSIYTLNSKRQFYFLWLESARWATVATWLSTSTSITRRRNGNSQSEAKEICTHSAALSAVSAERDMLCCYKAVSRQTVKPSKFFQTHYI